MAVRFIGGGNRSTRRKPRTCCKSVTNFITWYCIVWVGFELTTLMLEQVQYTVKIISMCRFKAVIWFCNYSKVDNTDTVHRLTQSTSWQGRQVDNGNIWSWQVYRLTRSTVWQCQYMELISRVHQFNYSIYTLCLGLGLGPPFLKILDPPLNTAALTAA